METQPRHKEQVLLKLFFEHGAAERTGDVEAVMATLCDHPIYELFPINYRMEGQEAVREFYRRMLGASNPGSDTFRVTAVSGNLGDLKTPVDVLWMGPDSMVTRDDCILVDAEGKERASRFLSIFTLQGYLLEGEIIHMSAAAAEHMLRTLGADFVNIPGVTVIP